jgi:hypothetical protein
MTAGLRTWSGGVVGRVYMPCIYTLGRMPLSVRVPGVYMREADTLTQCTNTMHEHHSAAYARTRAHTQFCGKTMHEMKVRLRCRSASPPSLNAFKGKTELDGIDGAYNDGADAGEISLPPFSLSLAWTTSRARCACRPRHSTRNGLSLPLSFPSLPPSLPPSLLRIAGGWRNLGGDHLLQGESASEYEAEDSEGPGSVTHY